MECGIKDTKYPSLVSASAPHRQAWAHTSDTLTFIHTYRTFNYISIHVNIYPKYQNVYIFFSKYFESSFLFYVHRCFLCVWMSLHCVHEVPTEAKEVIQSPGTGVIWLQVTVWVQRIEPKSSRRTANNLKI